MRSTRSRQIDALRAVAAISVLAYHALYKGVLLPLPGGTPLNPWAAHLDVGVPIFFVLSGFLLYGPFVRARLSGSEPPDVEGYGWRRVMRILPAYWVALVVVGVTGATLAGYAAVFSAKGIPGYFGLLQIYNPNTASGGINPAWTLCVEVTFYALLPLWAWLMRRLPSATGLAGELAALAALFASSVAWKAFALGHADPNLFGISAAPWIEPLPAYLDHFALGMALAAIAAARPRRRPSPAACWAIAGVAFWALATRIGLHGTNDDHLTATRYLTRHELNAVVAVALVAPVALGALHGRAARLLELRPLVFLGVVSYGIYLYHVGVLVFLLKHGLVPRDTASRVAFLAIGAPVSVLLGWASHRIVEQPCIALGRRLADARHRVTSSTPAPIGTSDEVTRASASTCARLSA
jgi:peptidoglycan/LPS O-acetylase OafA/YrhL